MEPAGLNLSLDDMARASQTAGAGKGGGAAGGKISKARGRAAPYASNPVGIKTALNQPKAAGGSGCSVYVGNLSWEVAWQELKDHFKSAGNVERADVMMEPGTTRSKGCGIVTFATAEEAAHAIATLHDTELMGRLIFVREDRETNTNTGGIAMPGGRGAVSGAGGGPGGCSVYVGNLSWDVAWQDLKDHFKSVGPVSHAHVMKEPGTTRSKGCGIVTYTNPADAAKAIATLHDTELMGRLIFVREDRESGHTGSVRPAHAAGFRGGGFNPFAQQAAFGGYPGGFPAYGGFPQAQFGGGYGAQGAGMGGCKLYVGGLPWETTWQDLKDAFKVAGTVVRADVAMGADGRSKGFGTVMMSSATEAAKAIQLLNDAPFGGRTLAVRPDAKA